MSYRVNVEWDDTGWWVVTVPDVPVAITQSHRFDVDGDLAPVIVHAMKARAKLLRLRA